MSKTAYCGVLSLQLAFLGGCAGSLVPEKKLVQIEVVTPQSVGRLEFSASRGVPFEVSLVPAGRTIYTIALGIGEYCLHTYVWGDLSVGHGVRLERPQCFRVRAEDPDVTYRGHVEFNDQRQVRVVRMPEAFERDMKDPSVEKVTLQTGLL